jgi:SAM-dependent methyltransferase
MSHYAIRGGVEGKRRLEVLGRALWPSTARLLERAGLRAGMACLDLGCGGGDVSVELARRVGPGGCVDGLDMDATKLDLAREDAARQGLSQVRFRQGDVGAWAEESRYDLVYCRFLLTHLREPARVIGQMGRALRPGGRAVVEDIDFRGCFSHPACPAFDRYVELYRAVVARRGGDADIGPSLHALAREAGFGGASVDVVQPVFVAGEGKLIPLLTLVNIADAVVEEGLAARPELERTIEELRRFTAASDTLLSLPRIFQVWGSRN